MTPSRFYFSLRSPYSWLAHHDLLRDHPGLADTLEWRPFWEPDKESLRALADAGGRFHYVPMSRAKSLYILGDVRRLAADRGLAVAWPVDREPHWEVPHLAYLAAAEAGRGREFVALAYRERWERGHDICARPVVAGIATELGLDVATLTCAAEDSRWRAEGLAALLELDQDGVFGVPFFRHGIEKYWGLDRLPAFATAADRAGSASGPAPTSAPPFSSLESHAGGCG